MSAVLALTLTGLFLIASLAQRGDDGVALRLFALAHAVAAASAMLQLPPVAGSLPPGLASAALLYWLLLQCVALRRLLGTPRLRAPALLVPLAWPLVFAVPAELLGPLHAVWQATFPLWLAGYAVLLARHFHAGFPHSRSGRALAFLWAGYAAWCAMRGVTALTDLDPGMRDGGAATLILTIWVGVVGACGTATLVIARNRAALARLASTDALTSAMNRRGLEDRAGALLARLHAERAPVAALMCDLDHFKRVNDRWGHHAGDRLLAMFSQVALANLRSSDLFGRLGGEEFVALLPGIPGIEEAAEAADRVRTAFADASIEVNGVEVSATVTIGVMFAPAAPASLDALLQPADRALYQAKGAGRNRTVVCGAAHGD